MPCNTIHQRTNATVANPSLPRGGEGAPSPAARSPPFPPPRGLFAINTRSSSTRSSCVKLALLLLRRRGRRGRRRAPSVVVHHAPASRISLHHSLHRLHWTCRPPSQVGRWSRSGYRQMHERRAGMVHQQTMRTSGTKRRPKKSDRICTGVIYGRRGPPSTDQPFGLHRTPKYLSYRKPATVSPPSKRYTVGGAGFLVQRRQDLVMEILPSFYDDYIAEIRGRLASLSIGKGATDSCQHPEADRSRIPIVLRRADSLGPPPPYGELSLAVPACNQHTFPEAT